MDMDADLIKKHTEKDWKQLQQYDSDALYQIVDMLHQKKAWHRSMQSFEGASFDMWTYRERWIRELKRVIDLILFGIISKRLFTISEITTV
jgi:hypothetical protein